MTVVEKGPNYRALNEYLGRFGIDATRVSVLGLNENGYQYVAQFPDGRPVYHNGHQLTYDWKTWPSPQVYENVVLLYGGGLLADINDEESIEQDQPKEDDAPVSKPTIVEKLEAPAEVEKPVAKRGRPRK